MPGCTWDKVKRPHFRNKSHPNTLSYHKNIAAPCCDLMEEIYMGKGLLLWLIGIPIPVIIILWLVF